MTEIKVIIFDLGGVVFENGTLKAIKYFKEKYSFGGDLLDKIFYSKQAMAFRAGPLKPVEFWHFIDSILPKNLNFKSAKVRDVWYNFYAPPRGMFELIKRCGVDPAAFID